MDITHLKYFVEVARQKSFTKAAQTLHVSQPSLSKAVRLLEGEWNKQLFRRRGHRIELTNEACAVLPQIEALVRQFEVLEHQMHHTNDTESGELILGIPPMIGSSFLSPIIRDFMAAYPQISLKVSEHGSPQIAQLVQDNQLQVGFVTLPVSDFTNPDTQTYIFNHQPLYYVMQPDSPFAHYDSVTLHEIRKEPLVFFHPSFSLYDIILGRFQEIGVVPQIVAQSNNWDFITELVKSGLGTAILPQTICERLNKEQLVSIPIEPRINWVLGMIWNEQSMIVPAIRLWVNYFRSHVVEERLVHGEDPGPAPTIFGDSK
ncbi:MAG: LysR family transcriptional regulator [Veillonella sp.]|uniref:LysR family transcriptional regulator n=1 Tax=Veillonella sp. TaxID=1926307 RepID=UPI0025CEAA3C|nr:LysR family transcriptional regulator [Veillonella sp.]MBE6080625.1 LysR family transcriptional regulator [Veillonella sp.]